MGKNVRWGVVPIIDIADRTMATVKGIEAVSAGLIHHGSDVNVIGVFVTHNLEDWGMSEWRGAYSCARNLRYSYLGLRAANLHSSRSVSLVATIV